MRERIRLLFSIVKYFCNVYDSKNIFKTKYKRKFSMFPENKKYKKKKEMKMFKNETNLNTKFFKEKILLIKVRKNIVFKSYFLENWV